MELKTASRRLPSLGLITNKMILSSYDLWVWMRREVGTKEFPVSTWECNKPRPPASSVRQKHSAVGKCLLLGERSAYYSGNTLKVWVGVFIFPSSSVDIKVEGNERLRWNRTRTNSVRINDDGFTAKIRSGFEFKTKQKNQTNSTDLPLRCLNHKILKKKLTMIECF